MFALQPEVKSFHRVRGPRFGWADFQIRSACYSVRSASLRTAHARPSISRRMTAVLKASSDQTTRVRRLAFKPPPKKEGLNKLSHDIMRTAEELSPGNENFASLQTDSVSQTPRRDTSYW